MKSIQIFTILILFLSFGVSCNPPKTKTIQDNDVSIELKVEDISETKLKFVTRGIGLDKTRGFLISLTIDDRNSVIVYQKTNMKSKPKRQYINDISSSFKAISSQDKKHIAISYKDTIQKTYIYHLLPKGEPFTVTKYNQTSIENIDWSTLPNPENIAIDFIKSKIGNASNYPINNQNLWNALLANMPNKEFDELVISCWPNIFSTHDLIDSLVVQKSDYTTEFFTLLKDRTENVFKEKSSTTNIINAIFVGYQIGDEALHNDVFRELIAIWPESPTLIKFVRKNYYDFPSEIQSQIMTKSLAHQKQTDTYAYKVQNKKFIEDFTDSSITNQ